MTEPLRHPDIDWAALAPVLTLLGTACFVLLVGVFLPRGVRRPFAAFFAAAGLVAAGIVAGILFALDDEATTLVRDSLARDRLAELGQILVAGAGLLAVGVAYF